MKIGWYYTVGVWMIIVFSLGSCQEEQVVEVKSEEFSLPMKGWYAGLQYNFSKRVFASATYSQSRLFTEDCYAHFNETQYKKGQYLVANVFWNVSHNLQVGAEYLHGWRENFNDVNREANRINLSAQYNF